MVMSGFSSCGILFSGGTQVSGQTMYSAEDRDIRGAEQDYKKLEKELDKKIKHTPTDHPGYNEYGQPGKAARMEEIRFPHLCGVQRQIP